LFGFGGFAFVDRYVRIMAGAGLLTVAVFSYLYLAPWRTFSRAVEAANWEVAGKVIGRLRVLVAVSLILGALTVVVGASGRYLG
jgi:uncharacterized membrane protein